MTPNEEPSLVEQMNLALVDLANACDQHRRATVALSLVRRDETDALNKVNEAQKRVDAIVARVKQQAPVASDWRRPPGLPA